MPIVGDVKEVLIEINKLVQPDVHDSWIRRIDQLKEEHPSLKLPDTDKLLARLEQK